MATKARRKAATRSSKPTKSQALLEARVLVQEAVRIARVPLRGRYVDAVFQLGVIASLGKMADAALRRHAAGK